KSTTFRLLSNLGYRELVLKQPNENLYLLGPGLLRLVQAARSGLGSIGVLAKPALVEAVERSGQTVALHVRLGLERICVEEVQSAAPIRYAASVGHAAPLHVGAAGKALLAFMDDGDELERTLASLDLAGSGDAAPTTEAELRAEIEKVRKQGYAASRGERIVGAAAVSVPIRSGEGALAVLSILGPASQFPPEREAELVGIAREAAEWTEKAVAAAVAEQTRSAEATP
ncbi:MAG TPA: IclR family transcriptional regulator, partial [Conexibacter sp.]|nr:IclR family transcriptional regulator [Conexibacter sp.]